MLGGFKWHSNAGGLEGGLLTQVSQGSHCAAGGTHRSHNTPSPLPPSPHALQLLLELQGCALVSGLEPNLDTHFFFSLKAL